MRGGGILESRSRGKYLLVGVFPDRRGIYLDVSLKVVHVHTWIWYVEIGS